MTPLRTLTLRKIANILRCLASQLWNGADRLDPDTRDFDSIVNGMLRSPLLRHIIRVLAPDPAKLREAIEATLEERL